MYIHSSFSIVLVSRTHCPCLRVSKQHLAHSRVASFCQLDPSFSTIVVVRQIFLGFLAHALYFSLLLRASLHTPTSSLGVSLPIVQLCVQLRVHTHNHVYLLVYASAHVRTKQHYCGRRALIFMSTAEREKTIRQTDIDRQVLP